MKNIEIINANKEYPSCILPYMKQLESSSLDGCELTSWFEQTYLKHSSYVSNSSLTSLYQTFLNSRSQTYMELKEEVAVKINEYQKEKKNYLVEDLFCLFFSQLIDQKTMQDKFNELKIDENYDLDQGKNQNDGNHKIKDIQMKDELNSLSRLFVNNDFNFNIEKTYNDCEQAIIDEEIRLFRQNFIKNERFKKYPNFFVHSNDPKTEINKIKFPYYPYQTLDIFLSNNKSHPEKYIFTKVDKIKMIFEISFAIEMLHYNETYHQCITSHCIYVDNKKNVYLSPAKNDKNIEQNSTKLQLSFYYRHPMLMENNEITNDDERIRNDIYSFGALIYEIITQNALETVFGNMPRFKIIEQLKKGYYNYLFKDFKDKSFDDTFDCKGIQNIIQKCMEVDKTKSYNHIIEVIEDLRDLDFYKENIDEIEYRLEHACSSDEYECTISDLVCNYYQGNDYSNVILENFFQNSVCFLDISYDEEEYANHDVITLIFEKFRVSLKDKKILLEEAFNVIIQHYVDKAAYLKQIDINLLNNGPMRLPNNDNDFRFRSRIIPITTLNNYVQNFSYKKEIKMWLYMIAKEIAEIHSYNAYHGEISMDSIGIYYNKVTDTFVPSVISFYYFYKSRKEGKIIYQNVEKGQKKDLKNFIKIVQELDEETYNEFNNCMNGDLVANIMVYYLHNMNLKNEDDQMIEKFKKNCKNYCYSALDLDFQTLFHIFTRLNKNDHVFITFNFFFVEQKNLAFFDLEKVIKGLVNFCDYKLPRPKEETQNDSNQNVISLLSQIEEINASVEVIFYNQFEETEEIRKQVKLKPFTCNFKLEDYSESKYHHSMMLNENISKKFVFRSINIIDLNIYSVIFIVNRCLRNLSLNINYKITIKLPKKREKQLEQKLLQIAYNNDCKSTIENGNLILLKERKNIK